MRHDRLIALLILALLVGPTPAVVAATQLVWSPDLQVVTPGTARHVSVVTVDSVHLRTIDVIIEADPNLLLDMRASPGDLFAGVPCMVWEESEILAPGRWHGFAVIIGAECETAGPGELLRWDFTAGPEGSTLVHSLQVKLYAPDGSLLEDVTLGHATILVSGTSDVPQAVGSRLRLAPNPFNPRVVVTIASPVADRGTVTVHDLRGRRVARLHAGDLPAGDLALTWNGRSDDGAVLPSGTYVFLLRTAAGGDGRIHGVLLR